MTPEQEIAALRAEIAALKAENARLWKLWAESPTPF
jgi:uncharacterized protein YdcH (DUF465 family)